MRITVVSAIILLCSIGFVSAEDGEINFAGEWILDAEKSEIPEGRGGRRGWAATKMVITQEENKLVVESSRTNRNGEERVIKATYTLDGIENGSLLLARVISSSLYSKAQRSSPNI